MSHELSFDTEGKAEMFYTGQRPWHGLGTELQNPATSEEAIIAAGLDWEVKKMEMILNGHELQVPGKMAMVRMNPDGTPRIVFGVVGDGYVPFQNVEAFDFFDAVVGEKKAIYHTAGALYMGRHVWILAKFPDNMIIKGKDEVEKFILLKTAHDGSGAIIMMRTPIRVVCNNTLNIALSGEEDRIFIRHTKNAKLKLEQARQALGIVFEQYKKFEEASNYFASVVIDGKLFMAFLNNVFPIKETMTDITKKHITETREKVTELFEKEGKDIPEVKDSVWAGFNAVAAYGDHFKSVRKETPDRRLESIWFGTSAQLKDKAWEAAMEVAKTA